MSELPRIEGVQNQKVRRHGCWLALFGCMGASLLVIATTACILLAIVLGTKGSFSLSNRGEDEFPKLKTVWSYGSGDIKVVRIAIDGPIVHDARSGFFGPALDSVEMAHKRIRRATNDPEVRAIILEINSPGGGITASDVLYNALINFKKKQPNRVVVALFDDLAASGAYYVATGADYIIAHPTTLTGSIGVIISTLNVKELADKIGVKDITVKSGENKDILNPFADFTQEQEFMLQQIIDEMHNRFVKLIAQSRKMDEDTVRQIADGQIFTASTALDYNLIDQIGYWDDAIAKTAELLGVEEIKVYRYDPEFSLSELLQSFNRINFSPEALLDRSYPRVMYMWRP